MRALLLPWLLVSLPGLAAEPDTAAIARAADLSQGLQQACAAQYRCAAPAQVAAALADAHSLGITCEDADTACWQRFAAAEGFARVVVAVADPAGVVVTVHEGAQAPRSARGATPAAALDAILHPPVAPPDTGPVEAPVVAPVAREPAAPAPAAPAPAPVSELQSAEGGGISPLFIGAVASLGVAVGAGVGAGVVSWSLAQALDDAAQRRAPLTDYGARNAAFFALAGVSAVGVVAAGALFGVTALSDDP